MWTALLKDLTVSGRAQAGVQKKWGKKSLSWTVYKINNLINGKVYIGIVNEKYKSIQDRLDEHIDVADQGGFYTTSGRRYALHSAIIKYGSENFDVEALENDLSLEAAQELERLYIIEYNSLANGIDSDGYNMSEGGEEPDYYISEN